MDEARPSVEAQIRSAQERGEFDNLPGAGKPLHLPEVHDPDWWIKAKLEREQLDPSAVLHPTLALRREAEGFPETLADLPCEQDVREVLSDYNDRVKAEWRRPAAGPSLPFVAHLVDVEALVARWRDLTAERGGTPPPQASAGTGEPVPCAPPPPVRRRGVWVTRLRSGWLRRPRP